MVQIVTDTSVLYTPDEGTKMGFDVVPLCIEPNGSLYFGGHFMRNRDESLFGKIIDFVNEYFEDYGRSPSTREIEQGIGASRPTIQRYLKTLQEQGEIEYDGHRGIITQYMRELMDTNRVQMGNSIPCGPLTEVTDAQLEHIRLPLALTGSGDFFLLRANGESMIGAGIDDGDLVLIRKQETPREGQIVAVLYNSDCTTLKRFHRESDSEIHLIPENDSMKPIVLKGEQLNALKIQGIATMVMKDLE